MVEWGSTVLEAKPTYKDGTLAFLTYDNEHHRVAVVNMPLLFPILKAIRGVDHIAFTYASMADLLATYSRLKDLGINPHWATNHGPTTSLYYHDPDGNQAELQVENFETVEEVTEWMGSGDFSDNPVGVDIDPDELVSRLASGEPESALKKREIIGKRTVGSVPMKSLGLLHKILARLAG